MQVLLKACYMIDRGEGDLNPHVREDSVLLINSRPMHFPAILVVPGYAISAHKKVLNLGFKFFACSLYSIYWVRLQL